MNADTRRARTAYVWVGVIVPLVILLLSAVVVAAWLVLSLTSSTSPVKNTPRQGVKTPKQGGWSKGQRLCMA